MTIKVFGCSAFGLRDCVWLPEGAITEKDLFLADAVLPKNPFDPIRTGEEAEKERIHTGLTWPPETIVAIDNPLRRVPIPCVWKLLVDAGDSNVRWNTGEGISFPLGKIIAAHVKRIFKDAGYLGGKNERMVVPIPNHLDEFGQESILKSLSKYTDNNVNLLWRPVSAAIAWLDKVQDNLPEPREDDTILIIYLGPDGIEFTPFKLREKKHQQKRFIIPLRSRPHRYINFTGADWAGAVIQSEFSLNTSQPGAFWQAFTSFPETWQAIAQDEWWKKNQDLPRPWNRGGTWTYWQPSANLNEKIWKVSVKESEVLSELLKRSCPKRHQIKEYSGKNWGEFLQSEFEKELSLIKSGRLQGVILCGPLAPQVIPPWIKESEELLQSLNFNLTLSHKPRIKTIWVPDKNHDPIAQGAYLFGYRLTHSEPTYLDTLPSLKILAVEQGEFDWVNLVAETECEGGQTYKNVIKNKFFLKGDENNLVTYLQKGEHSGQQIRDRNGLKYKKSTIHFLAMPGEDTKLDLHVAMRPAHGMAQVEIIPKQKEFLKGRKVFLDYSFMKETDELPEQQLGWPELQQIKTLNDPDILEDYLINEFLNRSVKDTQYLHSLNEAKKIWTQAAKDERNNYCKKIDQNGKAGCAIAQEVITNITQKLEQDFESFENDLLVGRGNRERFIEQMIIRGSWLWLSTPDCIVQKLKFILKQDIYINNPGRWNYFIEASSRCFSKTEFINILFKAIHKRIQSPPQNGGIPFPINSARAIYRVLIYRANGHEGLNEKLITAFLNQSILMLRTEVNRTNLDRKFFQAVLLFSYLLRYRKKNPDFLNPDKKENKAIFDDVFELLDTAQRWFNRNYNPARAHRLKQALENIKNFMYYKGTPGLIHIITDEAEG